MCQPLGLTRRLGNPLCQCFALACTLQRVNDALTPISIPDSLVAGQSQHIPVEVRSGLLPNGMANVYLPGKLLD